MMVFQQRQIAGLWFSGVALSIALSASKAIAFDAEARPEFDQFFADPVAIYGKEARYEVFRNDKKVGEHTLTFTLNKNRLRVGVKSSLVVRYLGLPVYRYSYTAIEQWQDGKLQSVESHIRDNFKKERVILAEDHGRVLRITDRGFSRTAPGVRFPSNHWHPAVVNESKVYHTLHGKVHRVRIKPMGQERIQLHDKLQTGVDRIAVIDAERYQYTGGFSADVWYDQDYRWVRLVFKADDGSVIDYRCVTCLRVVE